MFGLQPSDQEPDINAEHFGDADDQLDGRGACPPATHDGGDAAFGESTTGLDVAEAQVVHLGKHNDPARDGLAQVKVIFVRGIAVGVSALGLPGRHCWQRGHVTVGTLAGRACSGSGLPFTPNFGHLSKGFA